MKIVAQVKLLPGSAYEADALVATLRACNRAADVASEVAFVKDLKRGNVLQDAVYHRIKADFGLGAQAAVRTVKKVCDAYATLKGNIKAGNLGPEGSKRRTRAEAKPIAFREDAAQPFDDRILTWNLDQQTVSIWTVAGRLKGIEFVCSPEAMKLLASRKGESDLVMRDGVFFLIATIDIPEQPVSEPAGFLGVDLGIVNIATTSDGEIMSGRRINRYRKRHRDLRTKLQKKRTKAAKRRLKAIRRREARHAANTNHIIAKRIVATAERTSRGIALEDLSGIRQSVTAKKDQPHVESRNTSRQSSECRHTHRTNRVTQARFVCRSCGTVLHADHNGSRNIAHRGEAVWQRGAVKRPSTA